MWHVTVHCDFSVPIRDIYLNVYHFIIFFSRARDFIGHHVGRSVGRSSLFQLEVLGVCITAFSQTWSVPNRNTTPVSTRLILPCHALLCHAMPCHTMLCYAMPCYGVCLLFPILSVSGHSRRTLSFLFPKSFPNENELFKAFEF